MNPAQIIQNLEQHKLVFSRLIAGRNYNEYTWKPAPDKWCLLEIVCHLYHEEREDFQARTRRILETPDLHFDK